MITEAEANNLQQENRRLATENKLLREKIDLLVKKVFGKKSEKLDLDQLLLLEEDASKKAEASGESETPAEAKTPHKKKRRSDQLRFPEHLPVEEIILEPQIVQEHPQDWRLMGEERSEQLDYQPGKFLKRVVIRRKYVKKDHPYQPPVIAALPEHLQRRATATPRLMAHVVVEKYGHHQPLYRQQQTAWSQHQVWLPRQTLGDWIRLVADWLTPIYQQMHKELMEHSPVLAMDETPVRYLEPGKGQAPRGYFWVYGNKAHDLLYTWYPSRSAACIKNILPVDFKGVLQCDAYQAYKSFSNRRRDIVLAGCWAHTRRHFQQASENNRSIKWVLYQISLLYHIEKQLHRQRAGPQLKASIRSSQSRMIIHRLYRVLLHWKSRKKFLPKSNAGKAIDYALGNWAQLTVFLNDGRVAIDNNDVENAIRPSALGKKNWLFIADKEAGQRSAIIYTLIEACRRRNIDPYAYLVDVLQKLPNSTNRDIPHLTPQAWCQPSHRLAA